MLYIESLGSQPLFDNFMGDCAAFVRSINALLNLIDNSSFSLNILFYSFL